MKKEILTYLSLDLELDGKVRKIENQSLLALINPIDKLENNFNNIDSISNIRDINCNGGYFIFDALGDIKIINEKDKVFFSEMNEKYLLNRNKVRKIDLLSVNKEIYQQVISILINKIVRETHSNNILFVHYKFNTEYKHSNEMIKLNEVEKMLVLRINNHLKLIKSIIEEKVPNINIVEIDEELYLKDGKTRSIYVSSICKIRTSDIIRNRIEESVIFNGEKIHPSINSVRYCFTRAKFKNKDKLLIVFSAFSKDRPKYNYMNTLSYIDSNKLFILDDYGEKGTYYLGLNGQLDIETSVASLISKIMNENDILLKNVISIGTSKGGSAALYYGMKYNYGNIIIGAPQYKIGSYLSDLSIKTYGDEVFGKRSFANRLKYDNIIRLVSNNTSNVHLLTSDGDNQYKKFLREFENLCKELKINYIKNKCSINHHNEIAQVFPDFLLKELNLLLKVNNYKGYIINKSVKLLKTFRGRKRR